jgi:1-acyl-sn-glycerol-3-phosphate acyltransferase
MMNSLIRFLIRRLAPLLMHLEVTGLENLPTDGAYIAAANHLGMLDPVLVYYLLDRQDVILIVAEKHSKYAIVRWLVRSLNAIYIDRYNANMAVIRQVLKRLRQGEVLVIAPEGTRSQSGTLLEGRPGASFLAAKADLPVIPVGATGTEDRLFLANLKRLRKTRSQCASGSHSACHRCPNRAGRPRSRQIRSRSCATLPHCCRLNIAGCMPIIRDCRNYSARNLK